MCIRDRYRRVRKIGVIYNDSGKSRAEVVSEFAVQSGYKDESVSADELLTIAQRNRSIVSLYRIDLRSASSHGYTRSMHFWDRNQPQPESRNQPASEHILCLLYTSNSRNRRSKSSRTKWNNTQAAVKCPEALKSPSRIACSKSGEMCIRDRP